MTISQGGLIQATDYNTLRTAVSDILGTTGTNDIGYGQTIAADADVSNTTTISATPTTTKQWVALYNDIKKIADHQGTDITSLTTAYANNIKSGSLVKFSDITIFGSTLMTLMGNRLNIASTQYSTETSFLTSTRTTSWGSPEKTTVQHSFNITFQSADHARYYFNAGGKITFTPSLVPGSSTTQNNDWQGMLNSIGTVTFKYNSTSAYNSTTQLSTGSSGGGFYQLSTTPVQIYSRGGNFSGGATYAANDYTITASKNGGVITFNVYFNDDHTNPSSDTVTGTLTNRVDLLRPSGSNVNIVSPTGTNTVLLSDGVVQSYSITPNSTSVNEGSSVTYNIVTSDVGNTTLYWTNGGTTTDADFQDGINQGTVTITNNAGSLTRALSNDNITEGSQTIIIQLRTGSYNGSVVATASTVTVNDTSLNPAATYSVTPSASSVNEGNSVTFNVSGSNITNGTYYWTVTNSGDFTTNSGSFTITNNAGSFSVTPTADLTTEGSETFTASIRVESISGSILATSSSVTINDTSLTPTPTYTVTPASSSVNEGGSLTFNVSGTNIPNGTYYWVLSISTDFTDTSGTFTITNNAGSFTVNPYLDYTTEGSETFTASIKSSLSGSVLATSSVVTINDTSLTPTYVITPTASSVNEGSSVTFNVSGTGILTGTYYWYVTNSSDFTTNTGTFYISNNAGSFSVTPTADLTTEGSEIFTASIRNNPLGSILATSSTVTINDTSLTPGPTYTVTPVSSSVNEGENLTFNVSGTNITNGTYYYSIDYGTSNTGDFNAVNSSGSFTITNNAGSFFVTVLADYIPEGAETFTVTIRTGSTSGTPLATSSTVTINDTSKTTVDYQTTATNGTPFTWTISNGPPGATVTLSATGGTISGTRSYGTVQLDNSGYYISTNADFSPDYGNITVTFAFPTFTVTKNITVTSLSAPSVNYLVLAGGGAAGGGTYSGGGGGAGGLLTGNTNVNSNLSYNITVGLGGIGGYVDNNGSGGWRTPTNGNNSTFSTFTAIGGGAGGCYIEGFTNFLPASGGSGGGGGELQQGYIGNGTPGQGYSGAYNTDPYGAGGGGAGGTPITIRGGGPGVTSSISGSSLIYGIGGDGGDGRQEGDGANGRTNFGDGGSGANGGANNTGGNGGSGVVIIRYSHAYKPATVTQTTGSPSYTVSNGYRIYKFTANGSITF